MSFDPPEPDRCRFLVLRDQERFLRIVLPAVILLLGGCGLRLFPLFALATLESESLSLFDPIPESLSLFDPNIRGFFLSQLKLKSRSSESRESRESSPKCDNLRLAKLPTNFSIVVLCVSWELLGFGVNQSVFFTIHWDLKLGNQNIKTKDVELKLKN